MSWAPKGFDLTSFPSCSRLVGTAALIWQPSDPLNSVCLDKSNNAMVGRPMLWVIIPKQWRWPSTGEPQLIVPCYDGLATSHLDLDEPEQAEHYMRKARGICERAGSTGTR